MKNLYILFFILTLVSCSSEQQLSKEQILLQSIAELEDRFEQRKLGKIVEYVSENYGDEQGRTIRDIKRAIQMQLMRHKSLYVFSTIKDIKWNGDENVQVEIAAAMGGKPMESASILTSIRADMIQFKVDFVLEDEVFKVKAATWTRANPSDFL
ncbi:MAG: hypothetical protein L3J83_03745 [Proteobacteria bacterium]|nr:hypothetical protein [Pseudomonadota bacterium]